MSDDNPGIVHGVATADQCPHILLLAGGLHDAVLFKRCRLNRVQGISSFKEPPETISVASASP